MSRRSVFAAFDPGVRENDIVLASSSDGVNYSAPIRVAADPATSSSRSFHPRSRGETGDVGLVSGLGIGIFLLSEYTALPQPAN